MWVRVKLAVCLGVITVIGQADDWERARGRARVKSSLNAAQIGNQSRQMEAFTWFSPKFPATWRLGCLKNAARSTCARARISLVLAASESLSPHKSAWACFCPPKNL
ncbi:hypothetical protein ElyMa_000709300 [Elysia marginata]|uniref:Secreted protein n=1 Tax=Elysia marginata TaxID=1093978 RepID=A0AAV4GJT6_9GAST|nr:hypothetical protein ElyMa_000709300 [Elysia marginata]